MSEGGKSGLDEKRRSLLSFSRDAAAGGDGRPSPAKPAPAVSRAAEEAQHRHRSARSRREARPNPFLDALAATAEPRKEPEWAEAPPSARAAPDRGQDSLAPAASSAATSASDPPERDTERPRRGGLGDYVRAWMPHRPALDDDRMPLGAAVSDMPVDAPARDAEPRERRIAGREGRTGNQEGWTPLIDPLRVIGAVFDAKLLIVATTVIGTAIGVAIALNTPKKYVAATELIIDPRDLKLTDRDLTQQGLPSDATLALIENQVRIMTSGNVLAKVVDKLNLDQDSEFNGEAKSFGIRAFLSELRAMLSRSSDDGAADEDLKHTIAIENLSRALSVERSGKTFVVTVEAETQSPEKSALIANTMTDVFLQTYGQIQSQTAGRATDELTARLDELRKGVEEAERKVAAFKAENDIIDPQGRLITDDEIVKLNDQLSVARAHTLELNARAASVRGADVDSILAGSIPEAINSSSITELRSQYASLKNEADRAAVRLGPRHPERQAIDAQVAGARQQLATEVRRIGSSLQVELKRAVELEQQLAQRLAQLKVRQGDLSGELVTLRELEREATTKRTVYEATLLRARETGEQRDVNTANMSVISKAYPPLDPTGPSRSTLALTGTFLGFASGVGFAMLRGAYEGLRDSRRDNLARRRRQFVAGVYPDDDGANPPPRAPQPGGPSGPGTRQSDARTADAFGATSADTGHSNSGAHAQDHSPTGQEDNSMPNRFAEPYYPVAYGQPMPVQAWAPPTMPMQPVGAYPEPQPQAYPAYPPQHFVPFTANGQSAPVYAQPVPQAYAPAGYPQPMQAYPQPAPPVAPPPHYAYPPQQHHAQQMAAVWPQQAPVPYPPVQAYGAPPPAYPQAAHVYAAPPPMPPASAPAYMAAASRSAQPIPFPGRHASEAPRYVEEDNGSAGAIADIRASLAEFREAVRDFTDSRQRRRSV